MQYTRFYKTLGIHENASESEIRKAYRKLVKVHHPDIFVNASSSQQKMAEEKFIEIQITTGYILIAIKLAIVGVFGFLTLRRLMMQYE